MKQSRITVKNHLKNFGITSGLFQEIDALKDKAIDRDEETKFKSLEILTMIESESYFLLQIDTKEGVEEFLGTLYLYLKEFEAA